MFIAGVNRKNMTTSPKDILFARQPILDPDNKLYSFELLYRGVDANTAVFDDGNKATCEVLVNYCSGILADDTEPHVKIFINLTRKLILSDFFFPIDPSRLVIEILEDVKVDDILVKKVKQLKKMGYEFALDDYAFNNEFDPLLPLVNYIKVDLLHLSKDFIKDNFSLLMEKISLLEIKHPTYLAEKVEDKEQYDFCKTLGFNLFQGYYLERPQLVYGKKISNSSETALQIVAKLQEPKLTISDLCHSISRDTKLSYQLLKIVNSPLCRVPRKVDSLKEAVVFLGLEQVKKWAMALVMSGNSTQPMELFRILLTRARTCELFASKKNYEKPESFFTVGLFSGIDAVMTADKRWLLEKIELQQDMNDALLHEKGDKGEILKMVIALEHADWSKTNQLSYQDQIDLFSAHEEAINWAHQLCLLA